MGLGAATTGRRALPRRLRLQLQFCCRPRCRLPSLDLAIAGLGATPVSLLAHLRPKVSRDSLPAGNVRCSHSSATGRNVRRSPALPSSYIDSPSVLSVFSR